MIGESVKHLCENPKNYHVHCVGAIYPSFYFNQTQIFFASEHGQIYVHECFLYKGEKLRSMPASAVAKFSRMVDIYRRMLVTDICSIVYKSSWLSQSLNFGVGQIYRISASALFLFLKLLAMFSTLLELSGAPGSMVPNCIKFTSHQ